MKELIWNKASWHARLYRSTYYVIDMPDDICTYWWKLLLAIILFIPCWPGHLINWLDDKWNASQGMEGKTVWWWIHIPVLLMLTIMWMDTAYGKPEHWAKWVKIWGWYPIGIAVGIGAIAVICVIGFVIVGVVRIKETLVGKKSNGVKSPSPIVEGFKAWKNKYCSRINWK